MKERFIFGYSAFGDLGFNFEGFCESQSPLFVLEELAVTYPSDIFFVTITFGGKSCYFGHIVKGEIVEHFQIYTPYIR